MRWIAFALLLCLPALADDPPAGKLTWEALQADSSKGRELKKGLDLMKKYLEEERELQEDRKGASLTKVENARADWREWLDATGESLGHDLRKNPRVVVGLINEVRMGLLGRAVKVKRGTVDVGSRPAPGFSRGEFAYNVLVPKAYPQNHKTDKLFPLVVSLHGRAINLRHPALRKYEAERSRIVLWNNWGGDGKSAQQDAIVIAATGRPDGFEYVEGADFLRQTLFLAAGVGCADYMVDSQRIFVEVYGNAVVDAIELNTFFAGVVLRDREDAKGPPVDPEHFALVENLNGRPFYYVADEGKWESVGKPFAEALQKAYKAIGKEDNLVIEKVKRDANSALKADPEKMAKFLQARVPDARRELQWLFWRPSMIGPMPLLLSRAGYDYNGTPDAEKLALRDKCGLIKMKASVATEKDKDGKDVPFNVIDLEILEAEGARIFLYEPLVDLDLPVTVKVNGKVVVDKEKIDRQWELFELFCMSRKIFTYPVVATLDIEFDFKPRIEPPKVEEKPEEAKEAESKPADDKKTAATGN